MYSIHWVYTGYSFGLMDAFLTGNWDLRNIGDTKSQLSMDDHPSHMLNFQTWEMGIPWQTLEWKPASC